MEWKTVAVIAQLLFWSALIAWFQNGVVVQLLVFVSVFIGGALCYRLSRKHFGSWIDRSNREIFAPLKGTKK